VDFTGGFMKEDTLVRGTYMFGIWFTLPIQGKNKHCLETSVNNT
jgi:hypothetical protein